MWPRSTFTVPIRLRGRGCLLQLRLRNRTLRLRRGLGSGLLRRLGRLISETLPLSRYLLAGLKYANGRNAAKHTLSRRIDEGARRLADRAALASLTTNLAAFDNPAGGIC